MNRFYPNVRDCLSKVKKNEGLKAFYRGFFFSTTIFSGQLGLIKYGKKFVEREGRTYSEWERAGLLVGLIGLSELLFYPLLTVKYQFSNERKLVQINGAIGHTDNNFSLTRTASANSFLSLFRGLSTRVSNVGLYSLIYCLVLAEE